MSYGLFSSHHGSRIPLIPVVTSTRPSAASGKQFGTTRRHCNWSENKIEHCWTEAARGQTIRPVGPGEPIAGAIRPAQERCTHVCRSLNHIPCLQKSGGDPGAGQSGVPAHRSRSWSAPQAAFGTVGDLGQGGTKAPFPDVPPGAKEGGGREPLLHPIQGVAVEIGGRKWLERSAAVGPGFVVPLDRRLARSRIW